jgi:hypothetical protein
MAKAFKDGSDASIGITADKEPEQLLFKMSLQVPKMLLFKDLIMRLRKKHFRSCFF